MGSSDDPLPDLVGFDSSLGWLKDHVEELKIDIEKLVNSIDLYRDRYDEVMENRHEVRKYYRWSDEDLRNKLVLSIQTTITKMQDILDTKPRSIPILDVSAFR